MLPQYTLFPSQCGLNTLVHVRRNKYHLLLPRSSISLLDISLLYKCLQIRCRVYGQIHFQLPSEMAVFHVTADFQGHVDRAKNLPF